MASSFPLHFLCLVICALPVNSGYLVHGNTPNLFKITQNALWKSIGFVIAKVTSTEFPDDILPGQSVGEICQLTESGCLIRVVGTYMSKEDPHSSQCSLLFHDGDEVGSLAWDIFKLQLAEMRKLLKDIDIAEVLKSTSNHYIVGRIKLSFEIAEDTVGYIPPEHADFLMDVSHRGDRCWPFSNSISYGVTQNSFALLHSNRHLVSSNGETKLTMHSNCNLAMYVEGAERWSTKTIFNTVCYLWLNMYGNLMLLTKTGELLGELLWDTSTMCKSCISAMSVTNNHNLLLARSDTRTIAWKVSCEEH